MRHLNNGTDHRHSKSCCDQSSPARRTITPASCVVFEENIFYLELCMLMNTRSPGPRLNIKTVFLRIGIPIIKIRRSRDRLIFVMGIPILVRRRLFIETAHISRWNELCSGNDLFTCELQWNLNQITMILIEKKSFENVFCKMIVAIPFQFQCVI